MRRRVALVGAAALAAGAAGLGTFFWQQRSAGQRGAGDLRPMQFQRPEGGTLRLVDFEGSAVLLNFWATWCPPCVTELPLLDRFHRSEAVGGWKVIGLAVDNVAPVLDFLKLHPVGFPIGMAGLEGVALSRTFGNTTGGLPFTLLVGRDGRVVDRKLGALTEAELASWRRRGI